MDSIALIVLYFTFLGHGPIAFDMAVNYSLSCTYSIQQPTQTKSTQN
jgi:hypothetical protein